MYPIHKHLDIFSFSVVGNIELYLSQFGFNFAHLGYTELSKNLFKVYIGNGDTSHRVATSIF